MSSVFVSLARRGSSARRSLAADFAARPLRVYRSPLAAILDPANPAPAGSEPVLFRQLALDWEDRETTVQLTEAIHRLELRRAKPVIEVTVTTPPGGIPRADLARLVQDQMAAAATAKQRSRPDTGPTRVLPATSDIDDTQVIQIMKVSA